MIKTNEQIGIPFEEFVDQNYKLAHHVAQRYVGRLNGLDDYDDLYQIALLGMIKAYENFNPAEFNTKFSTYAIPKMIGEVQRHLRDHSTLVKFPRIFKEIWKKVVFQEIEDETPEMIAEKIGVELRFVEKAMKYFHRSQALSLDAQIASVEDKDITLHDQYPVTTDYSNIYVNEYIKTLTDQEKRILELRMIQDMTQSEIGKIIGVSQVQVSRILKKMALKLEEYQGLLDHKEA